MSIRKKFIYDEHDQSVDIQSYEDAVKHAFADVPIRALQIISNILSMAFC